MMAQDWRAAIEIFAAIGKRRDYDADFTWRAAGHLRGDDFGLDRSAFIDRMCECIEQAARD